MSVTAVTADDAEVYGLDRVSGVLVQSVTESGPADEAGLKTEDVIVSVEGDLVDRAGHLQQLIAQQSPGDDVELEIMRDGRSRTLTVELGTAPISGTRPAPVAKKGSVLGERLGMEVTDLDGALADRFGFSKSGGVVVAQVEASGPAARKGVTAGLRVLSVNRHEVGDAREMRDLLADGESGDVSSGFRHGAEGRGRLAPPMVHDMGMATKGSSPS